MKLCSQTCLRSEIWTIVQTTENMRLTKSSILENVQCSINSSPYVHHWTIEVYEINRLRMRASFTSFIEESCLFPATKRRGKTASGFNHVEVQLSPIQHHLLVQTVHDAPSKLYEVAWATLLSTYIRTSTVSFAVLSSLQHIHKIRHTSQNELSGPIDDVSIARYRVSENSVLNSVHEVGSAKTDLCNSEDHACNTAVSFFDSGSAYLLDESSHLSTDTIVSSSSSNMSRWGAPANID